MASRTIHFAANGVASFLKCLNNVPLCLWCAFSLAIALLLGICTGGFQSLVIVSCFIKLGSGFRVQGSIKVVNYLCGFDLNFKASYLCLCRVIPLEAR